MESKKKWQSLVLGGKLKALRRLLKRECKQKGKKIVALTLAMMFLFNMMPNIPMLSFLGEASVSETTEASASIYADTWSNHIDTKWYNKYKKGKKNCKISTPEQLAAFAKVVNETDGKAFKGKTVTLTANIDLSAHYWEPIGTGQKPFKGTFDGGNKAIKGLKLQTSSSHTGLFGKSEGTIKNVNINSGSMELHTANDSVGGVVGYCTGDISNCKVNLSLIKGVNCVGGIVGDFRGNKISDCVSNVSSIKGKKYVGGIVGKIDSSDSTSYISNCKATVTNIEGEQDIGGIAGSATHVGMIDTCVTVGATANAKISGDGRVGGIVGKTSNFGSVYQCENNVAVSGRSVVGGVAGLATGDFPIEYSSNHGSVSAQDQVGGLAGVYNYSLLMNCVNTGSVYGSFSGKDDDYCGIGGLVGSFNGTYVAGCINIGAVSGYRAGGLVGSTDDSARSKVELDNCWWLVGEGCTTTTVESGGPLLGALSPFEQSLAVGGVATIPTNNAEAATSKLKGSDKLGKDFKVTVEYEVSEPNVLDILKSNNVTEYAYAKAAGTSDVIAKVTLKQNGLTDSGWTGSTLKITTIQEKIGTVAVGSNQVSSSTDGIIWVEKIIERGNYAGQSIWYGIDNSSGIFKEGSRVSITQIEDDTEQWNEYYSQIDDDKKAELAEGSLLMFDISIVDPDGNEYKNLPEDVSVYVQVGERLKEHLKKNNIRALFIQKGANENIDVTPALDMEYPGGTGDFVKLTLKHFSPYAVYGKLTNRIQTGDENYNLIVFSLAAGLLVSGASVLIFKRRKKYYID